MTANEVLHNFRRALIGVVPAAEAAGIPWRRPDAYDEWDAIAQALYNALVVHVIRWSLPENEQPTLRMPAYDLLTNTYAQIAFVQVQHASLPAARHAFHAFGTEQNPFDTVETRQLSDDLVAIDERLVVCPLAGATFSVRINSGASPERLLHHLNTTT